MRWNDTKNRKCVYCLRAMNQMVCSPACTRCVTVCVCVCVVYSLGSARVNAHTHHATTTLREKASERPRQHSVASASSNIKLQPLARATWHHRDQLRIYLFIFCVSSSRCCCCCCCVWSFFSESTEDNPVFCYQHNDYHRRWNQESNGQKHSIFFDCYLLTCCTVHSSIYRTTSTLHCVPSTDEPNRRAEEKLWWFHGIFVESETDGRVMEMFV